MIFKFGLQGKAYFKFDSSSSLALRSPDFRKRSGASSTQPVILCLFFFCGIVATFSTFFVSRSQDVLLRVLCQIRTYTTLGRRENER